MRALLAVAGCLGWSSAVVESAHADGPLPPQPYNYLHPPAALAGSNSPPRSGHLTLSVDFGRSHGGFGFTADGQAGITVHDGAFKVAPSATSITVQIQPVETPSGAPAHADGNAYKIVAVGQPGSLPATLVQRANLTLRWPYAPSAVYEYRDHQWGQLCASKRAVLTSATISCPTSTLGIFLAVGSPSASSLFVTFLPWIIGLAVVIIAVVVVYLVERTDRRSTLEDCGGEAS